MDKLLLIDGNSLINRAYYAFGGGGGLTWNGNPTNATYGFLNMFFKAVGDIKPKFIAVAFDVRAKTFRHKMYNEYKATRKGMPDDLAVQLFDLKSLLGTMGVMILECEGFEADDIIGTLAKKCQTPRPSGTPLPQRGTIILSADRDGLQLVDDCTELHLTKTGVTNLEVWDKAKVMSEYNLTPQQLIDLKALVGDKSDNIPGAMGVGEKTGLELMQTYGSLEKIYDNLENIREALREKLKTSRDMVFLSRDLARINRCVPCDCAVDNFTFEFTMGKHIYDAFDARGFKSLCKRPALWKEDYYSEVSVPVIPSKAEESQVLTDLSKLTKLLSAERLAISNDVTAYYINNFKIPIRVDLLSGGFDELEILTALKPIFVSPIPKAVFDSKALKAKHTVNNIVIDVKLCEHLLTGETNIPQRTVTLADFDYLQKLTAAGMLKLYQEIELPLVDILIEMQRSGAKIDLKALERVSENLQAQIAELTKRIYEFAGTNFNINSPQQLGEVLFNKLGVETTRKTKTGWSTDEFELQKKAGSHPIVPQILRYRKMFKLYSTYIQGYKNSADSNGFVHSTFHNTATVTGRLSSSEPNLQNIPIRSEDADLVRKLFVSRYDGGKIISADYNQIELRLLAHFSQDAVMLHAYRNGHDIHTETAMKVFDVTAPQVTSDMRRKAKAVNFGIVYGQGAFGLSESVGCSVSDASKFIDKYFKEFSGVKAFLDKCRDDSIVKGYASTLFGRRRILKELSSTNQQVVGFGMRAAVNMPMQGSASDIIKKAMVAISKRMYNVQCIMYNEGKNNDSGSESNNHCKLPILIAQVHDELVFDCPLEQVESTSKVIKEIMESIVQLSVPLTVNIEIKETL